MLEFNVKDAVVKVDPNNHWPHLEDKDIMATCGLLIDWLVDGCLHDAPSLGEHLHNSYVYSMGWHALQEGADLKDNQYLFPGDPPLHCAIKVTRGDEAVYIFPHAIVIWVQGGKEPVMERMD